MDHDLFNALIDAVNGKNLVIEGPPGTGKSQTIINLIAAALARGKRVLFVSAKLAALEVVKDKLEKAGLGAFCLELHGQAEQAVHVLRDVQLTVRAQLAPDATLAEHPWYGVGNHKLMPFDAGQVCAALATWQTALEALYGGLQALAVALGGVNDAAKARLEQNPTWHAALGPWFAGLDTPIADLRELRAWYRAVRQRFGVGFGPLVPLGDALIALEPGLVQGLQSLVSQGVNDHIDTLLGHLGALRTVFPGSAALSSNQTPLTGPAPTIETFGAALAAHLGHCQTHLRDANATVDTVVALLVRLQRRDRLLRDWQTCTIDPAWFGGTVDLRVPPDQLTPENVRTAVATFRLAQAVEQLKTDWLPEAIRRQPTAALFASLQTLSERLASDLETESSFGTAMNNSRCCSDSSWPRASRQIQRMHLFASMGADDIQVGANSSRGVKAFHDFLAYAGTGVPAQAQLTGLPPDSDFEIAVAAALGQAGFDCVPQVGMAGFFIDLAVRDPGRPGRYLMGIECDGATYHSAKSVRDRDRLRQAILEGLGWQIRRIWSTDWYKNPQAQIKPIIAELNQLKTGRSAPAAPGNDRCAGGSPPV